MPISTSKLLVGAGGGAGGVRQCVRALDFQIRMTRQTRDGDHDVTRFVSLLASIYRYDKYNSLRATTIKLSSSWAKSSQRGLLSKRSSSSLNKEAQRKERSRAFDLLDALSKSGALTLGGCTLHIVLAATHCFDLDLLNTVRAKLLLTVT